MKPIITSAHQPAFLMWAGYLHKMMLSDYFIIMDSAKFRKRSFMHRNNIEINKVKNLVGLQISKKNESLSCKDVILSNYQDKNLEEIKFKIFNSYKNYEFFSELEEFLNYTFDNRDKGLMDIFLKQINFLKKKLKLKVQIILESEIQKNDEYNFENTSERLIQHAIFTNANIYVTGIHSIDYIDKEIFEKKKIYNHIQKFDYQPFLEYQYCIEPLSIVHQIAKVGFLNLKSVIEETQENKIDIIKIYDRSRI